MSLNNLIREVHRRSLWQVLGVYAMGSWVALQVVDTVVDTANLPEWLPGMALVFLVIGLPIVLATAIVQQGVGSHGGDEESDAAPPSQSDRPGLASGTGSHDVPRTRPSTTRRILTWRNAIVGGVAAFALWGVIATGLLLTGARGAADGRSSNADRKSIAVLPFATLGGIEEGETLSFGLHDDLLTRLSKVGSLRVISRTSMMKYKDTEKSIPTIADELGVATILEGSVSMVSGRVNINAQLIDAGTDEHLWAETYNQPYTVAGLFTIQREIAERITSALSAALLPEERSEIETPPTTNLEAYNFYQRGNTFFEEGPSSDQFDVSFQMYERAIELDADFALAYAKLARALGLRWQWGGPESRSPELRTRITDLALRALEIEPAMPEAWLALGQYYYTVDRDFDRAMDYLDRARDGGYRDLELYHITGAVLRRMPGRIDESVSNFEEAVRLDPLSGHLADDLGSTLYYANRFEEAERTLDRAIALNPGDWSPYRYRARVFLALDGADTRRARAAVAEAPDAIEDEFSGLLWEMDLLDRDFDGAIARLEAVGASGVWMARSLMLAGRTDEARVLFDDAIEELETRRDEDAQFGPFSMLNLAEAYAGAGRDEDAIRVVDELLKAGPMDDDVLNGSSQVLRAARVLAAVGQVDATVAALETLAVSPMGATWASLSADPAWDPIRDDPRFQALASEFPTPR